MVTVGRVIWSLPGVDQDKPVWVSNSTFTQQPRNRLRCLESELTFKVRDGRVCEHGGACALHVSVCENVSVHVRARGCVHTAIRVCVHVGGCAQALVIKVFCILSDTLNLWQVKRKSSCKKNFFFLVKENSPRTWRVTGYIQYLLSRAHSSRPSERGTQDP